MELKDFKNTKIYLPSVEEMVVFQGKAFKLGMKWADGSQRMVILLDTNMHITINDSLELSWDTGKESFIEKRMSQIFLEDIISIEESK